MKILQLISLLVPALMIAGPVYGHVTGIEHPAGPFHSILGIDHILIVLAIAAALGIVAYRRR
ncbi:MAG: hypothetical protein O7G13_11200 [Alphaproteobacteria bacterium]|nr:hypothetical protein [Alphaproteobacteria bacterium]